MMEEMKGDWVILKDDEIIANDKDIKKILELAKEYDENEITIAKNSSSQFCFY